MRARALIADDEPLLRAELRRALEIAWPQLEVVAEAADGLQALDAVRRHEPDIAFFDVAMPRMNGVDAAQHLRDRVLVVFLTAYEEYAVKAFAQRAVDYLVKPLDEERLADTVQRLQRLIAARGTTPVAPPALPLAAPELPLEWFKVNNGNTIRLIAIDDVYAFRAVPGYTQIVTADAEHFVETPLCDLLPRLDGRRFVRVHRAAIVDLRRIAVIHKLEHGRLQIELKDGRGTVEVSRARAEFFRGT